MKTIIDLRALIQEGADQGADYHAKPEGHWINSTVLVEVEASDGTVGFAMTTGGVPAAYLIENH